MDDLLGAVACVAGELLVAVLPAAVATAEAIAIRAGIEATITTP